MKGQMTDKIRVHHILDAISEIENYLSDVTYEIFLSSSEKRFATIKQIEIIGEACWNASHDREYDKINVKTIAFNTAILNFKSK